MGWKRASAGTRSIHPRPVRARTRRAPPDFGLVTPERLGDVVAPMALRMDTKSMSVRVKAPATPGRYRLTVMLHDKDGVAYDAASQAQLLPLIVRLTGPNDAGVSAPSSLDLQPGEARGLTLWVDEPR